MFKSIYGTSIAAHIREHRMEYAAQLLQNSNLSIADIASKVVMTAKAAFLLPLRNNIKCFQKNIEKIQIYLSVSWT